MSRFEPQTAVIRKGKTGQPTEFGRVGWLDEVDGGLISGYRVLAGNPDESAQLVPRLEHHVPQFGHPPDLLTADRGVQSSANERAARERGVTEVVLPKPGRLSAKRRAPEQQEWFQAGRRWRAGIDLFTYTPDNLPYTTTLNSTAGAAGVTETVQYDADNRPTTVYAFGPVTATTVLNDSFTYGYDPQGHTVTLTVNAATQYISYDALGRLRSIDQI